MLVTTLVGLAAFEFNGLMIGPVVAVIFMTVWSLISLMGAADGRKRANGPPHPPVATADGAAGGRGDRRGNAARTIYSAIALFASILKRRHCAK